MLKAAESNNQKTDLNTEKSIKNDLTPFFAFIVIMRVIATCLITNTHLNQIYPVSWLAVGGLFGDSLFFIVSGFCLAEIGNNSFFKWYGKRLFRIYPSVLLISIIFCVIGRFQIQSVNDFLYIFLYPTKFPFIGSIVMLYVFFYVTLKIDFFHNHIPQTMLVVGVCWLLLYIFLVDKSTRIDTADYYLTKFLFFEAMLYGAYIRLNTEKYKNKNKWWKWCLFILGSSLYLGSKMIIDKFNLMNLQFIIILFVFFITIFLFLSLIGIEKHIPKLGFIYSLSKFLAPLTLEIYIVQHYIISIVNNVKTLVFPLNFIIVITNIVISAFLLNKIIFYLKKIIVALLYKLKNKKV